MKNQASVTRKKSGTKKKGTQLIRTNSRIGHGIIKRRTKTNLVILNKACTTTALDKEVLPNDDPT